MLVTIQKRMLLFLLANGAPVPALMRSPLCEEALAGIILHRPPSLRFAWVRSCGTAGSRGAVWKPGTRDHIREFPKIGDSNIEP